MSFEQSGQGPSAEQRRKVEQLAAAGDALALAQVEAWARAAAIEPTSGLASLANLLPAAAALAVSAFRRVRPKLWAVESDRYVPRPSFNVAQWERAADAQALKRRRGDVGYGSLVGISKAFGKLFRAGKGATAVAYKWLAPDAGCSRETLRRAVQYYEDAGLLHVWNRTDRPTDGPLKNQVVRVANMYLAVMPGDDLDPKLATAPESAPDAAPETGEPEQVPLAQAWLARVAHQIERGGIFFRLAGRRLGLNLTPLRPARAPPA